MSDTEASPKPQHPGRIVVADWSLERFCGFRTFHQQVDQDQESRHRVVEPTQALSMFGPGDTLLEELLDDVIVGAMRKKPAVTDTAACRIHGFRDTDHGRNDRQQLHDMIEARDQDHTGLLFDQNAAMLARRYAGLTHARDGVLMFVRVSIRARHVNDLPFILIAKLDYEDARAIDQDAKVEILGDVILRRLRCAMVYPYFDGLEQDFNRIKVMGPSSDYFNEWLWLDQPATQTKILGQELQSALRLRHEHRYDEHFVADPPKRRELFGEERYIPLTDLLPYGEVKFALDEVAAKAPDKTGKPPRAAIKIDGTTKVEFDLGKFGQDVWVARDGEHRVLVIRGESFTTSGPLTGLDFLEPEELTDTIAHRVQQDE